MKENTDQPNFVDRIAEVGFEARWNAHRKLNSGRPIGFSVLLSAFSSPRAPPDFLVLTTSARQFNCTACQLDIVEARASDRQSVLPSF